MGFRGEAIQKALEEWKQGDCVLGEDLFLVHRFVPDSPLTEASRDADQQNQGEGEAISLAETKVVGFALLTQTCDIVRSYEARPYVEVAPLVLIENVQRYEEVCRGMRPQYASLSGISERRLVVDLDRTNTLEKAWLAQWQGRRITGCTTEEESRAFALSLARKRARFAFPDDFVLWTRAFQDRLKSKHAKESSEGSALRSLREIRVRASPSWSDETRVDLEFFFLERTDAANPSELQKQVEGWRALLRNGGRFQIQRWNCLRLKDMDAQTYAESDPFDLDYLSLHESRS